MNVLNIFSDIWSYFNDGQTGVDGSGTIYENLGFEKSPLFSLRLSIIFAFIGVAIACFAMLYNKRTIGGIVRKIIAEGASSPESAKTLAELGLDRKILTRNAIVRNVTLRRYVKCVEEEEYLSKYADLQDAKRKVKSKYYIDLKTDRFYIPEEKRIQAEIRYEKKGSNLFSVIFAIVLLSIALLLIFSFLPNILGMIDSAVSAVK